VFERFTDRARRVVVLAQEEARLLHHNYIGTEHLLLGLVHSDEGIGAQALAALGVSLEGVRAEVEAIIGTGERPPVGGHIPFTPRAKKVLELSLREALKFGHNYIGTEHLLLGLLREGEGVAAQVLIAQGLALETVRAKVLELLGQPLGTGAAFSGDPEASALAVTPPVCPYCATNLRENLRRDDVPVPGEPPLLVVIAVSCGTCSRTLGLLPSPA